MLLGWVAVILGVIGLFLPVLPTTPFIILAAFIFGKGSPKTRQWLLRHPTFGRMILEWEENGAISAKIKVLSCSMMVATLLTSWWFDVKPWVLIVQLVCVSAAAYYILSRPTA